MEQLGKRKSSARGFTLVELVMVVAILLVVAAMATPYMVNVVASVRLRAGMTSLAGIMQDCRSLAIKNNKIMTTHFTALANGPVAYVKDATISSPTLASTDPQVQLGAPVTQVSGSSLSSVTGAPTALDSTTLGFTPQTGDPSFNTRGLPCPYSSGTCTSGTGFAYYFTDTRPLGKNGWAAVTISPAGRVKVWMWTGSAWGS